MERTKIIQYLNRIFIDIIDNEDIRLTEVTTAGDVDGWDSLTHVQIAVAIEKQFKIRFTAREIQSWRNVGELLSNINSKLMPE